MAETVIINSGGGAGSGGGLNLGNNIERIYPFNVLPQVARNTFTGAGTFALIPGTGTAASPGPVAKFLSGNNTEIAGRLFEVCVEAEDGEQSFPGSTIHADFPLLMVCHQWHSVSDLNALATTAWAGIEMGSFELNSHAQLDFGIAAGATPRNVYQVRQQLKDPTQWELFAAHNSGNSLRIPFTVPPIGGASAINEGHSVALYWDPFALFVAAYVDGIQRARFTSAQYQMFAFPAIQPAIMFGLAGWSGIMSAPAIFSLRWQTARITTFGVNSIGSGLV